MIQSQKIRILWLTDIHFSFFYDKINDERFTLFLKRFFDKAVEQHMKRSFDYIFLTGDLAQMGIKKDYESLKRLLLDPLLTTIKNTGGPIPKVITIPGNHDLMWKNSNFLSDYINYIDTKKKITPDRPQYLQNKEQDFRKLFKDYTAFLKGELKGAMREFYILKNRAGFEVSKEYRESRLFGYLIDRKKNLAIIMLNTAWFSLGDGFNKVFIDYIKKNYKLKKVSEEDVDTWLKTKDYLTEYNKQISGIQLLYKHYKQALDNCFNNYPDCFVITVMHHSKNWLEWTESFTYGKNEDSSAVQLKKLTQSSNLVLTGHEHVPIDTDCERLLNNIIHLKGGCFLEFNQVNRLQVKGKKESNDNYLNNWFSILEINTSTKIVEHERYCYDSDNKFWLLHKFHEKEQYATARRSDYALTSDRNLNVLSKFKKGTLLHLKEFLEAHFGIGLGNADISKITDGRPNNYQIYLVDRNGHKEFCVLARQQGLYRSVFSTEVFFTKIIGLHKKYPQVSGIRFLMLDLLVDGPIHENYLNPEYDRDKTFNLIVKQADNLFDIFRHSLYDRWEKKQVKMNKAHPDLKALAGIRFINQVIPYWIAEKFWL